VVTDAIDEPSFVARIESLEEGMDELVASVKEVGILQPLVVVKKEKGYEVVAGHRRLIAAKRARLAVVPVIVSELSDDAVEQVKLHENLKRVNLGAVEEAVFLVRLIDQKKWSQSKVAKLIGKSDGYVSQRLAMLDWDEDLLRSVQKGDTAFSVGRALNEIKNKESRAFYTDAVLRDGASLAVTKRWVLIANAEEEEKKKEIPDGGVVDETPSPAPYRPTCWLCGTPHEMKEMITIQLDKECAKAMKEAQEAVAETR